MHYRRAKVKVHLHTPSKRWRFTCGKQLARNGRLRQKDFYFTGTKESAEARARKIAAEWNYLTEHWATLYQPTLPTVSDPHASIPHWSPTMGVTVPEEYIEKYVNETPTRDAMSEANVGLTLQGLSSLYLHWMKGKFDRGEIRLSTYNEANSRIKSVLVYYPNVPVTSLTSQQMMDAKQKLLTSLPSRRTAKNYAMAVKGMLEWYYQSSYGKGSERFDSFDECFYVPRANSTAIKTYTLDELKTLFENISEPKLKLCILLALNCGMYQADIAALCPEEIESDAVFWDREKEPDNPFKLYHKLWEPTRKLMKKYWGWKVNPDTISWWLAEYNRTHKTSFQFKSFRKTANDMLVKLVGGRMRSGSTGELVAVEEISKHFLGQRTPLLVRLYRTTGKETYKQMNFYLAKVGEQLEKILKI